MTRSGSTSHHPLLVYPNLIFILSCPGMQANASNIPKPKRKLFPPKSSGVICKKFISFQATLHTNALLVPGFREICFAFFSPLPTLSQCHPPLCLYFSACEYQYRRHPFFSRLEHLEKKTLTHPSQNHNRSGHSSFFASCCLFPHEAQFHYVKGISQAVESRRGKWSVNDTWTIW